jgi:protein-disulfide isomerase
VVILAVVLGVIVALDDDGSEKAASTLDEAEKNFPYDLANGAKLGKDDALLKLTMYEDFQCPFCLRFTINQEPTIIEEYVKTGKLQIEYKHLPVLGTESTRAGKGAVCAAEQDKFWQFHNRLFRAQADAGQLENERVNVGRFSDDNLKAIIKDLGGDADRWQSCFDGESSLQKVQDDQREATSLGIRATPGFRLNGQPLGSGAPSEVSGWRKIFDDALKALTETPTGTAASTGTTTGTPVTAPAATATPTRTP